MLTFDGELKIQNEFDGELRCSNSFDGELSVVERVAESYPDVYDGRYEVVPDMEDIVLPCADKLMADDVTVKCIPVWQVSNTSGGLTVIIGGEFDYGESVPF